MRPNVRERLRRIPALRAIRFLPYVLAYQLWSLVTRPDRNRFLFLSDSHDGFVGNFLFLRTELLRQHPDADVRGVFKPGLRSRRSVTDIVRLPYLLATSGTIILDDFYPLIYPMKIRKGARLVQVWHAVGAFKQVGHSRAGLPGGPVEGSDIHRNYTDATVSSESIRADYAEAYGIDVARVRALGVPRTDPFFDEHHVARVRDRVRAELGIEDGRRLVLFAPTFRGNGQLSASVDESADWSQIAGELGEEYQVVVRVHPFTARTAPPLAEGLIDGSGGEMNDLLMATDVLVTDYSSSIFEFALLRRPFVLFTPDLAAYAGARSFYRPIEHYAVGPIIEDPRQLASAIAGATADETRLAAFLDEFCGTLDGRSSERIVREILLTDPAHDPTRADVEEDAVAPGGSEPEPTRAAGIIGLRLLAAVVARSALRVLYAPMKLLPLQRKVVMVSREHPTVPDDFVDLRAAIHRADPSVRVVVLVRMVPSGALGKISYGFHLIGQLLQIATARALVVDTYSMAASLLHHRPELTVIQMWHALGAFKKFGLSILGQAEGRDARLAKAMRMHEGYDLVLASGEAARGPFAEALNTPLDRVRALPLPRVDRLRDPARRDAVRARFFAAHPHLLGSPIALFAPTFRLDGAMTIDAEELHAELRQIGVETVVKLHPLMAGHFTSDVTTAPGFSTQEILQVADLFITDYSSALFEAAVVGIPCYFLAPDLDEYLSSRNFYFDYRTALPGPIVTDIAALVSAVSAGSSSPSDSAAFCESWISVPGAPKPAAGSSPCADAIAETVLASMSPR